MSADPQTPSSASLWKKAVRLVFGVGVAAGFGYVAFRNMEWGEAWSAVLQANPLWLFLGVVALGIDYSLRVVRWWIMMRPVAPGLTLGKCFGPFLASIAMNNVLPFRAGDVARAFGFQRILGANPAKTLGTMLVERLFDLVTLLGFLYVGLALAGPGAVDPGFMATAGVLAVIGVGALIVCLAFPGLFLRWAESGMARLQEPKGAKAKFLSLMVDLFATLKSMQNPVSLASIVLLSVVAWFLEGCLFAFGLIALQPDAPLAAGWFALATGTLATLIPSTPGYVGTFDYMAKLAYEAFGVSSTLAGATAILVHVLIWVPLTLVGGGWLLFSAAARRKSSSDQAAHGSA